MVAYKTSNMPTGYVPYFYEAGQYLWQPMPQSYAQKNLYSQSSSGYDFSSDVSGGMSAYRPQTVDQIIRKGYLAVPESEPETAIITDKHQTSWQGLDDVIHQIRGRYSIYADNMRQIEHGKCYAISAMFDMEAYRGNIPSDSKEQYRTNKQLHELYQQERDERVRLWQDVSKLRSALPENAQRYLSASRKLSMLNDEDGDGLF